MAPRPLWPPLLCSTPTPSTPPTCFVRVQKGYLQYKKDKGKPVSGPGVKSGGVRKRKGGGGGRKRKASSGGGKRARKK